MATFGTGNYSFGSNPATAPSGGFGFGPTTTTTAPAVQPFGGFGTVATTSAPSSLTFSGFGTTAGSTPGTSTGFGGLGFGGTGLPVATTTAAAPSFSFAGLGTSTTSGTGFGLGTGFGSITTSAPSLGTGFGFGGFGAPSTSTSSTGFSFGGLNTGFGGSGTTGFGTTQSSGLFGKPSVLGGTGLGQTGIGAAPSADQSLANLTAALFCPVLFGDERDTIVAKCNRLQAFWGTGKGFYAIGAPPVDFTVDNPFCKFKAVGYSCLPSSRNEDGFVSLLFNRKEVDIRTQQPQVVEGLHRVFGSRPTLSVCVEGVKPAPDNKSEVTIYIIERAASGVSRRIPTSELFSFVNQANIKLQLTSLGVEAVIPKAAPSAEQLRDYLEHPPAGIDPSVWQQAILDNPDPKRLIPVPMIGFAELNRRLKCQEEETRVHQGRLNMIANELCELQKNHTNAEAKISELKCKHLELSHRILKVMVRQEIGRKLGLAVQADEEQLRIQLEAIHTELSAPNQAKGRLNELMSQIRLQREHIMSRAIERYTIDSSLQEEIKQHLRQQQEGLAHLIAIVKEDMKSLKLMEDSLKQDTRQRK